MENGEAGAAATTVSALGALLYKTAGVPAAANSSLLLLPPQATNTISIAMTETILRYFMRAFQVIVPHSMFSDPIQNKAISIDLVPFCGIA